MRREKLYFYPFFRAKESKKQKKSPSVERRCAVAFEYGDQQSFAHAVDGA